MFQMPRSLLIAALLFLLTGCTPPASSAPTASPSPSSAPSATVSASPTATTSASTGPGASATPIALPSTTQLSAPSANVVWALVAGNRLFRSTDRGETWQDRSAALDPLAVSRDISFISDSEGWQATTGPSDAACPVQAIGVAHTTDGAATWSQVVAAVPLAGTNPSGLFGGPCKSGLIFADPEVGFLSSRDPNSAPVIYRTADRGRTWGASRALPDPPGFATRAGGALQPGRVRVVGTTTLLVAASGDTGGRLATFAFRSVDGGSTWSYLATIPEGGGAFTFVSATRWLQIGAPGSSKETTDGGTTWHAFTTDYSQAAPIAPEVVFGDPLVGYATVRGAIQRTTDGGAHWTTIKTPGT
jgi:photosystem II stability/assembly factor-like uncharacterized protein